MKKKHNNYCLINKFNMKKLNECKKHILQDKYNKLIEFINMTKNKFLF